MSLERCSFAGFDDCVVFRNNDLKIIVTTEVGPRILFFGHELGPNHFYVKQEHQGLKDGQYHSYGGHRLWVAPEEVEKTYTADSFPVQVTEEGDVLWFASPVDPFNVQKKMGVRIKGEGFQILHRVHNRGAYAVTLAPWAVTVMAAGGELLVPQEPFVAQSPTSLLPVRPLVLWPYTRMQDERWNWGDQVIRLRQLPIAEPQKFGTYVSSGIAVYANFGATFVKRFETSGTQGSPDMGCNFEAYTRNDMLEVESLGLLQSVAPGNHASLTEGWFLETTTPPSDDARAAEWLNQLAVASQNLLVSE